jgi:hypothetical protein
MLSGWAFECLVIYVHETIENVGCVEETGSVISGRAMTEAASRRQRPRFAPGRVCVGFVVDKLALWHISPSSSALFCQHHSTVDLRTPILSGDEQACLWPQFRDVVSPHWHKHERHLQVSVVVSRAMMLCSLTSGYQRFGGRNRYQLQCKFFWKGVHGSCISDNLLITIFLYQKCCNKHLILHFVWNCHFLGNRL